MKHLHTLLIAAIASASLALYPHKVHAHTFAAPSAALAANIHSVEEDNRVLILKDYLIKQNSPLADHAETFVEEADRNNLDWKLVVSISGLESGFGKHIPAHSYNGWGWGVYGDNVMRFNSWDEAIATVSAGLREKYMDKWGAKDVYGIGRRYAASPTWAVRVIHFMSNLEKFEKNWTDTSLSLSI